MTDALDTFRYLSRADVLRALPDVDVVAVVSDALRLHAENRVLLPEEAYLPWTSPDGAANRCLAMPAALDLDDGWAVGLKTINASLGNTARGLPRSQGFTLLLDHETARPRVLLEAALVSALRTAAVTAVAALTVGVPEPATLGLIGCGTLAMAHLTLLADTLPTLREVRVFDVDARRAAAFVEEAARPGLEVIVAGSARECVTGMDLVVPVTTVTEGYIPYDWLTPGTLVSHVSLDDLLPDAVHHADLLVIDDWDLVSADHRRLLGRMYRAGELLPPSGIIDGYAGDSSVGVRKVDATLGEIVSGAHPGRSELSDIVVCNAFGMAILDIAVAHRVADAARRNELGSVLTL